MRSNEDWRCEVVGDKVEAEETVYQRIDKFHAHLDVCSQCRNHSFDLCASGAALLKEAAETSSDFRIQEVREGVQE